MGKPYKKELEQLSKTYEWANLCEIGNIRSFISSYSSTNLIFIGSGGAYSACIFGMLLQREFGYPAEAITPLGVHYNNKLVKKSKILLISASGKNKDIQFAFKKLVNAEPTSITSITMRLGSPLAKLSHQYSIATIHEYDTPTGKDGFLATNSLLAYFVLLFRIYSKTPLPFPNLPTNFDQKIDSFINKISSNHTLTVLYGGWGYAPAIDLESKCIEAALCDVHLSDFRNFGHGRHHWFDKRADSSSIVALVTPKEKELAKRTLDLIPDEIPKLILSSDDSGPFSSICLLIQIFHLVEKLGAMQQIDPGRPGVPDYGRKLYNLNYFKLLQEPEELGLSANIRRAVDRKLGSHTKGLQTRKEASRWKKHYTNFVKKLNSCTFGALVFDYDGTLCSTNERLIGINEEIAKKLNELLTAGCIIGIATGRGKSVRIQLQKSISKEHWRRVVIGYYNGGDIGFLGNDLLPDRSLDFNPALVRIENFLQKFHSRHEIEVTLRPKQLTIESNNIDNWSGAKHEILQFLRTQTENVQIKESGHSIDILTSDVSKIEVVKFCKNLAREEGIPEACLTVGDSGSYTGNDYELLSTQHSLSVDSVSQDAHSCWNLAPMGLRNVEATSYYLNKVLIGNKQFKIKLPL